MQGGGLSALIVELKSLAGEVKGPSSTGLSRSVPHAVGGQDRPDPMNPETSTKSPNVASHLGLPMAEVLIIQ